MSRSRKAGLFNDDYQAWREGHWDAMPFVALSSKELHTFALSLRMRKRSTTIPSAAIGTPAKSAVSD